MKRLVLVLGVVLCATVFAVPAHSQIKKLAQTGLQFLKVDVSPRAAAMGGAYTMAGNDASAIFYNPAGMAWMDKGFDFFSSRTEWIVGISYNAAAIAKSFGGVGTFGASLVFADYGDDIIGTRVAQTERGYEITGTVDVGAYAIGLSYARALTDQFSIGGQVKYASQHLGSSIYTEGGPASKNEVSGVAFDFGTIFYPGFESLQIGMSVNNFSGEFQYEEERFQLPLTFRIGVAMDVLDLTGEHSNTLLISVDALHPRDYTERLHIGGEYWYNNIVALRAGYKFNYDEEDISAGVGLKPTFGDMNIKLDYAFSSWGRFGSVHRFAVGLSF